MRWTNGDKGATHRANALSTIFTPIRSGTARLAINLVETAETAPAFSLLSTVLARTAANKSKRGLAIIADKINTKKH